MAYRDIDEAGLARITRAQVWVAFGLLRLCLICACKFRVLLAQAGELI
jgi:hypothetical protein